MNRMFARRTLPLVITALLVAASAAAQQEVRVVTSGGFTEAYKQLAPQFERQTGIHVISGFGASMGATPDAIPNRLNRGEPIDVIILAAPGLDDLIKQGKVDAGTRVDLVRSLIAMAVRTGAPKPDISSVDALKRTLLEAKSIGYSDSASGVYLRTVLFPRLGIADQITSKSRIVEAYRFMASPIWRADRSDCWTAGTAGAPAPRRNPFSARYVRDPTPSRARVAAPRGAAAWYVHRQ